jgi:hypothetical protein
MEEHAFLNVGIESPIYNLKLYPQYIILKTTKLATMWMRVIYIMVFHELKGTK